jgi:hypothetical protein
MFREFCRWEVGVHQGWLPMTRRYLDCVNLESEVVGGKCRIANPSSRFKQKRGVYWYVARGEWCEKICVVKYVERLITRAVGTRSQLAGTLSVYVPESGFDVCLPVHHRYK